MWKHWILIKGEHPNYIFCAQKELFYLPGDLSIQSHSPLFRASCPKVKNSMLFSFDLEICNNGDNKNINSIQ